MAITMGFVLRVDSYPPAVALPPAVQPGVSAAVVEPSTRMTAAISGAYSSGKPIHHQAVPAAFETRPLTYNKYGANSSSAITEKGRLINIYA